MAISLTSDLANALDPARLFRSATGHTPDRWQAELLRSSAPRILLNCCRQSGKSSAVATLALHEALFRPGSLTLALSPSLRQSQELFKKITSQERAMGRPAQYVSETTTQLETKGGSRVVSLPENETTIRGYSGVTLLIIDEASRVADDVYSAVLPMLGTSHGRLIALSTPWGKQGWWYERWISGGDRWERYEVPVTIPEIAARTDPQVLIEAQARGPWWYGQEYQCQFGEREDAVFSTAHIQRAIRADLEPLDDVLPVGVY
jgi:hypothetical protein